MACTASTERCRGCCGRRDLDHTCARLFTRRRRHIRIRVMEHYASDTLNKFWDCLLRLKHSLEKMAPGVFLALVYAVNYGICKISIFSNKMSLLEHFLVCALVYVICVEPIRSHFCDPWVQPNSGWRNLARFHKRVLRVVEAMNNRNRSPRIYRRQCEFLSAQCEVLSQECQRVIAQRRRIRWLSRPRQDFYCSIRKVNKLVEDCCAENWLLNAVVFGSCRQHFLEVLHDIHRSTRSLTDQQPDETIDETFVDGLRKSDSIDLREMVERQYGDEHYLADQLREKPVFLHAPPEISRHVTEFDIYKTPVIFPVDPGSDGPHGPIVFRVMHSNIPLVIKMYWRKGSKELDQELDQEPDPFQMEADSMKKCRHPDAVGLVGYWEVAFRSPKIPLLLMESMECNLRELIDKRNKLLLQKLRNMWRGTRGFSALDAVKLMLPVAKALRHMHNTGFVHRDIKPHNILYTHVSATWHFPEDMSVKLADFGSAQEVVLGATLTRAGTNGYMDPYLCRMIEQGDNCVADRLYKADVFSFGLVFGEVLTGSSPWEALDCTRYELNGKLEADHRPPLPEDTPHFVKSLVESCWRANSADRPSFVDICDILLMESMEYNLRELIDKRNKLLLQKLRNMWRGTRGFSALDAVKLMLPVAKALRHMHNTGLVHRDIKPHNILYTHVSATWHFPEDMSVKLADFGSAQEVVLGATLIRAGTKGYMDPYLCRMIDLGDNGVADRLYKADVFSFGLVFGEVLTGSSPWEALDCTRYELNGKLEAGHRPPLPEDTPHIVKSLVKSCWRANSADRPSFVDICDILLMESMEYNLRELIDKRNKLLLQKLRNMWRGTRGFSALDAVKLMLPVAKALRHMHNTGLVHRDIKPHNILYTHVSATWHFPEDMSVKLADFGSAQEVVLGATLTLAGTKGYMDPYLCRMIDLGDNGVADRLYKADVFSFGLVFGEVLTGSSPWEALDCTRYELNGKLEAGHRPPLPEDTPHIVKSLVKSCWRANSANRPSFVDICDILLMESMEYNLRELIDKRNKLLLQKLRNMWRGTRGFSALDAVKLMLPVAKALRHMHNTGLVHRDIKPHNILYTHVSATWHFPEDMSVKLADFACAQEVVLGATLTLAGTYGYMDPYLCRMDEQGDNGVADRLYKADVFSFGLVFGEVLTGSSPWEALDCTRYELNGKLEADHRPPLPEDTPHIVKSLVKSCWRANSANRPSFVDICDICEDFLRVF